MAFQGSSLRTGVARRIVSLFLLSAIVPTSVLALVTWHSLTTHLEAQAKRRMYEDSKHFGLAVYARLQQVDQAVALHLGSDRAPQDSPEQEREASARVLAGMVDDVRVVSVESWRAAARGLPPWPAATHERLDRLATGRSLLVVELASAPRAAWLMRTIPGPQPQRILAVRVAYDYLFGEPANDWIPEGAEAAVFDERGQLYASLSWEIDANAIKASAEHGATWYDRGRWLAGVFPLSLGHELAGGRWTVVTVQPREHVYAALGGLRRQFAGVVGFALLLVALLSLSQMRRQFAPLERLHQATRRLSTQDFDTPIGPAGDDEFGDLTRWFEEMREQLRRQFGTLSAVADLDRAILSTFDTQRIVAIVLERLPDVVGCTQAGVTVLDPRLGAPTTTTRRVGVKGVRREAAHDTAGTLHEASPREWSKWDPPAMLPGVVAAAMGDGAGRVLTVPMVTDDGLAGVLTVARDGEASFSPAERETVAQLANQAAVALSNAALVARLDRMNRGALNALARTVDAKSTWTAGHSERVTNLAVDLGRALGLDGRALETLRRGGLLHDIGKIGVPAAILDKPGKLTAEEMRVMRQHPDLGAHILAPIPEYADIIPIVLEHHERFDGRGYPRGLQGTEISLGARIFAVADVYDALTSQRPYRGPLRVEQAIAFIRDNRGTHFDPQIANAFIEMVEGHLADAEAVESMAC